MYKFKIKLLYNQGTFFRIKIKSLNFKIIIPLAKLDTVGSRLVSNVLISPDDIPVDIQWVTFLLLSNSRELGIGTKTKKLW